MLRFLVIQPYTIIETKSGLLLKKTFENIIIGNCDCEFFCGGKGAFDSLCYYALCELKQVYKDIKVIYITPYFFIEYQRQYLSAIKDKYDDIIFPDVLTTCPPRLAYVRRNQWMVDEADIIISYVVISGGGSEAAINYAKRKNKPVIDIINFLDK